jgi:transketolase
MRDAFAQEITALSAQDERLVLLSGDIGNRMFDNFKTSFPERFFNCGVAEANMISMAAGLALCDLRPFAYTIVPFITTRCLEQIRVDLCYHNLPVVIVGVGGGLAYASLGATHQSCEDIALLRVLPHMTVICPGDAWEVRAAVRASMQHDGPVYIRLGKKGEPTVHEDIPEFEIGKGIVLQEGKDVCLLSTGNLLPTAVESAEKLKSLGISVQLVSFHTVKPLDQELLERVFSCCPLVVTLEEHSILGGLGGSIAEWLVERPSYRARLVRIGTEDRFLHESYDQDHLRQIFGLTPSQIVQKIQDSLPG